MDIFEERFVYFASLLIRRLLDFLGRRRVIIVLSLEVITLSLGILLMLKPRFAIEMQRIFYRKINWIIEPVSMPKEVFNTRAMGFSLLVLVALTIVYIILRRGLF